MRSENATASQICVLSYPVLPSLFCLIPPRVLALAKPTLAEQEAHMREVFGLPNLEKVT